MALVPSTIFSRLLANPPPPPRATPFRPARAGHRIIPLYQPPPLPLTLTLTTTRRFTRSSAQENGGASETLEEKGEEDTGKKEGTVEEEEEQSTATVSAAATEIKEKLAARKRREESSSSTSSDMLGGVAEEIKQIEWPVFGKVLGTTGVVLAVIVGSSIVLLTVNAVLAEISDRVFVGKGLQDFF